MEIEKYLEPCPICKRRVTFNLYNDPYNSIINPYNFTIQCSYCGLYMEGSDEESLIKRWNNREKNNYDKS